MIHRVDETRVAIVTGASSGLGLAISESLSTRGFVVVGVGRRNERHDWPKLVTRGLYVQGDVAEHSTATYVLEKAERQGQVELVVNSAGTGVFRPAGEYEPDDVAQAFSGAVTGLINVCDVAISRVDPLKCQIVNILSMTSLAARSGESVYSAAKWAGRGYTEALQLELKQSGPNVVAVYPGGMKTDFWAGSGRDISDFMDPVDAGERILEAVLVNDPSSRLVSITFDRTPHRIVQVLQ